MGATQLYTLFRRLQNLIANIFETKQAIDNR